MSTGEILVIALLLILWGCVNLSDSISSESIEEMQKSKRLILAPMHYCYYYMYNFGLTFAFPIIYVGKPDIDEEILLFTAILSFLGIISFYWTYQSLSFEIIPRKCSKDDFLDACEDYIDELNLYETILNEQVLHGFRTANSSQQMITIIKLENEILFKSISTPYRPPMYTFGSNTENYERFLSILEQQ